MKISEELTEDEIKFAENPVMIQYTYHRTTDNAKFELKFKKSLHQNSNFCRENVDILYDKFVSENTESISKVGIIKEGPGNIKYQTFENYQHHHLNLLKSLSKAYKTIKKYIIVPAYHKLIMNKHMIPILVSESEFLRDFPELEGCIDKFESLVEYDDYCLGYLNLYKNIEKEIRNYGNFDRLEINYFFDYRSGKVMKKYKEQSWSMSKLEELMKRIINKRMEDLI